MTSVAYGIAMPASRAVLTPPNVCAQAQAFFARLATQPSTARKALYNAMIASLVSAGVWSKLDALYMFAGADQLTALMNLVSPNFGASAIGSPTFTTDIGFTGASGKYVDSNFNPSTAAAKFQQNDASLFAWGNSVAGIAGETIGSLGTPRVELVPRYTDTNWYLSVNGSESNAGGQADGSGLRTLSRSSSTTVATYKGGTFNSNVSQTSTGLPNANIFFLRGSNGYYVGGTVYCGGFGSGLTSSDVTALYSALHSYLQAVAGIA
jgi:hypothetical protein